MRPARQARTDTARRARSTLLLSSGSTLYLAASAQNRSCSSRSFLGSLAARSLASLKSLVDVVKLPFVVVRRRRLLPNSHGSDRRRGAGDPAVVVDGAVAEHLEILRAVLRRRLRVIERVDHAHALDRLLRHAVEHRGRLHADGFEDGRIDVDDTGGTACGCRLCP